MKTKALFSDIFRFFLQRLIFILEIKSRKLGNTSCGIFETGLSQSCSNLQ